MLIGKLKTRLENAFRLNAPKVSQGAQEHDELMEDALGIDFAFLWTKFCGFFCLNLVPFLQRNNGSDSSDNFS